jgi:hypothetical protein
MRAFRFLSILLALLLIGPAIVRASGMPEVVPSQPTPPASGPGGPNTRYPGARSTLIGPAAGGYWVFEPTTGSAADSPVVATPGP